MQSQRTQMLAAMRPPDRTGRRALAVSCFLILLLLFIHGLLCTGLMVTNELLTRPGLAIFAAVIACVLALPYLLIILWLDRNEPEPPWLLATAFAWGAIGASSISIIGNFILGVFFGLLTWDTALADQLTASFSAPLVEETSKALALWAIYLLFRNHFDNVLDGIIYGAFVGLGFAIFENFIYYMDTDHIAETLTLMWARGVVTAPGTHICFTAITGASLGLFRVRRAGCGRWLVATGGLALAMFAHFVWNTLIQLFSSTSSPLMTLFIGLPLAVLFLQVPFLTMVLLTATLALRHERRIIETYLASERPPVCHPRELARLVPARRRTFHGLALLGKLRVRDMWIARRRNRLLVQLAFEKWHMDREADLGADDARDHALRVQELRRRLTDLPEPPA